MTFDEALALLEIDEQVTAKQAKRAYLRQVKRFKPEQDPVGFQRVREAYELVTPVLTIPLEIRQQWAAEQDDEHDESTAPSTTPHSAHAPEVHGDSAGDSPGADDDDDDEHDDEHDDDDDLGLLYGPPVSAKREEMRQWLSAALPQLLSAFENADERPDEGLPVWSALQALGMLAYLGKWKQAHALGDAIRRWQANAASHEIFRGGLAARWALLSDLVGVGPHIDSLVVQPIARSLMLDDANVLALELRQYKEISPHGANAALLETQARAPFLHGAIAEHLRVTHTHIAADDSANPGFRSTWPFFIGLFMLFNVVRAVGNFGSSSSAPELAPDTTLQRVLHARTQAQELAEQPIAPPPPASAAPFSLNDVERARSTLYDIAKSQKSGELGGQSERVFQAFLAESCDELIDALQELERATRGESSEIRDEVQRYWGEQLIACPNHKLNVDEGDPP